MSIVDARTYQITTRGEDVERARKYPRKMELPNILLEPQVTTFVEIHYYTHRLNIPLLSLYSTVLLFHPILLKLQDTIPCYSVLYPISIQKWEVAYIILSFIVCFLTCINVHSQLATML